MFARMPARIARRGARADSPVDHTCPMPVARETDALAAAARRHLRRRTVLFAGLIGVGVMIAAVIGTLSMQVGRWQSGLLATGSQVEGTVIAALLVGSQRRSNESHVTVQYFTPDGRDHSFSFHAVDTSRDRPGERVTVYYDPASRGHHRTRWDAPRTATQNSSAAILLLSTVIALVGLLGLPRAVIGMRLGRGPGTWPRRGYRRSTPGRRQPCSSWSWAPMATCSPPGEPAVRSCALAPTSSVPSTAGPGASLRRRQARQWSAARDRDTRPTHGGPRSPGMPADVGPRSWCDPPTPEPAPDEQRSIRQVAGCASSSGVRGTRVVVVPG